MLASCCGRARGGAAGRGVAFGARACGEGARWGGCACGGVARMPRARARAAELTRARPQVNFTIEQIRTIMDLKKNIRNMCGTRARAGVMQAGRRGGLGGVVCDRAAAAAA